MKKIKNKSISPNIRKDIFSNKRYEKKELIKLIKNKDGIIELDFQQQKQGRGMYIHPETLSKIYNTKNLENYFIKRKYILDKDIIEKLKERGKNYGKS